MNILAFVTPVSRRRASMGASPSIAWNFGISIFRLSSPGPTLDNLKIEIPKFHAMLGEAPIDARLLLTGVTKANMFIDAYLKASLNLEDLLKMFPMEGQDMK